MPGLFLIIGGLFLIAAVVFILIIGRPTPEQQQLDTYHRQKEEINSLLNEARKVSEVDVSKNRLVSWWNRGQVEQTTLLIQEKLKAASALKELHKVIKEHETIDLLHDARVKVEAALLANQAVILQEATALQISPEHYSSYVLQRLNAQIEVQKERFSIEETIKLAITEATHVFQYQQALIRQIAELEDELQRVPLKYQTEAARKSAAKEIQRLIKSKQGELRAAKSESFLRANGKAPGGLEAHTP